MTTHFLDFLPILMFSFCLYNMELTSLVKDDLHVVDVEGERRSDERGLSVEGGGGGRGVGGRSGRGGARSCDGGGEPHAAALRHHDTVVRRHALRVCVRRGQDAQALGN